MEIVSLSILLTAIVLFEEIFNGQLGMAQKLLDWFEKAERSNKTRTSHNPPK